MKKQQYRHGDVFLQSATIPENVKPVKGLTLAWGEATGHHHSLEPIKLTKKYMANVKEGPSLVQRYVTGKELLELQKVDYQGGRKAPVLMETEDGRMFFRCFNTTVLTHQEHSAIVLPAGDYERIIQREYSPEAIKRVVD